MLKNLIVRNFFSTNLTPGLGKVLQILNLDQSQVTAFANWPIDIKFQTIIEFDKNIESTQIVKTENFHIKIKDYKEINNLRFFGKAAIANLQTPLYFNIIDYRFNPNDYKLIERILQLLQYKNAFLIVRISKNDLRSHFNLDVPQHLLTNELMLRKAIHDIQIINFVDYFAIVPILTEEIENDIIIYFDRRRQKSECIILRKLHQLVFYNETSDQLSTCFAVSDEDEKQWLSNKASNLQNANEGDKLKYIETIYGGEYEQN